MEKFHAVYRIGENMHFPRKIIGTEIHEITNLKFSDFIEETENLTGVPVSLLWFGRYPMKGDQQ